jgi:hypothetical protein
MKPKSKGEKLEPFGPFTNVPSDQIQFAGFPCCRCRKPVRRFGVVIPGLIPRAMFYGCRCGNVMVWEDERQPTAAIWLSNLDLLKDTDCELAIFNGGKETPPGFQGIN